MNLKYNIALWLLLFLSVAMQGQNHESFYYYKGEKVFLEVNTEYMFLSLKKDITAEKLTASLGQTAVDVTRVVTDNTRKSVKAIDKKALDRQGMQSYWAEVKFKHKLSKKDYLSQLAKFRDMPFVVNSIPYFKWQEKRRLRLSDYFYVKLKDRDDVKQLYELAEKYYTEVIGHNKYMPLWFILSCKENARSNAMQIANRFHESNLFEFAEPDLMVNDLLQRTSGSQAQEFKTNSNDPYFNDQWGLKNTGQDGGTIGIDINIESAWGITKGNPNILVAVYDEGFEQNHLDLQANNWGNGYDIESGTSPSVIWGSHGTACAGIVGAKQDNNQGVSGVAPNVKMTSVSIRFWSATYNKLADGINWAAQNGADVISNSWGGGSPSAIFDNAIDNAFANGRGGLGTVVVFSSGNNNNSTSNYPGNSNELIINVGAIDRCGVRSGRIDIIPQSCDPWCSNCQPASAYGTTLDVVASGSSVSTTDRQGSNGYNANGVGNYSDLAYHNDFGGTSAACPVVAGVAALVLSANPNLTVQEVNDIIEQSAQKVRTDLYSYTTASGRPNGTWNNKLGYGLVDAYEAVLLAQGCNENLTLSGTINNSQNYAAASNISSTQVLTSTANVEYKAGNTIKLIPGFQASLGSIFHAYIYTCNGTQGTTEKPSMTYKEEQEDFYKGYFNENTTRNKQLETPEQSNDLQLSSNPNPFTNQTTIAYQLEADTEVVLQIFDATGRQITQLVNGFQTKGQHQIQFHAGNNPVGMYYARLQSGQSSKTIKLVIIRK